MNAAHTSIAYRGAPFIISAADVPAALALMRATPTSPSPTLAPAAWCSATCTSTGKGEHHPGAGARHPEAGAAQDRAHGHRRRAIGVLEGYLKDSGLYNATSYGFYPTIGDVFTAFDNVADFTTSNGLVAGGFAILWAPHWNGANNTSPIATPSSPRSPPSSTPATPSSPSAPRSPRSKAPPAPTATAPTPATTDTFIPPPPAPRTAWPRTAAPERLSPPHRRRHRGQPRHDGEGVPQPTDADRRLAAVDQHGSLPSTSRRRAATPTGRSPSR